MIQISRFFFVGLCFLMVSCSVLSGGESGDTDVKKYAKDLSFPLNEEHLFSLKSCMNNILGASFFKMGVLLGADISTLVCLYKNISHERARCSILLETWLKNQYSDGTRNSEVTLMRLAFALHKSVGSSKSERLLATWKGEYYRELDVDASKKLVDDEYHIWKKTYKEHLHSTCDDVYNKAITTAN